MRIYELINHLRKIPNQNLDVQFARMSNSFIETNDFTEVIAEHNRCLLVKHVRDWAMVNDDKEYDRMKENHEIM